MKLLFGQLLTIVKFLTQPYMYRVSSLSTIFGILKKLYYAKFILHSNSTSTNFIPMAMKFVQVEIVLVETVLVGDPLYLFFISKILHLNEASSQKNVYP